MQNKTAVRQSAARKHVFFAYIFYVIACSAQAQSRLQVGVSEKFELFTTIQHFSGYPVMTISQLDYKRRIRSAFYPYRGDRAVKLYGFVGGWYLSFSRPYSYLSHFNFPPLKPAILPLVDSATERDKNYQKVKDSLGLFIKEMNNFYTERNFHHFFLANKPFYDSIISDVKKLIGKRNYVAELEKYYGKKFSSYNLVLVPLMNSGGFGVSVYDNKKKRTDLYAFIGPETREMADTALRYPLFSKDYIEEMILHEMGHSFANPVIDKYYDQLSRYESLAAKIKTEMKKEGNGDSWKNYLNEHLVRAVVIRLIAKSNGEEVANKKYEEEIQKGYKYLDIFLTVLKSYEKKERRNINMIVPDLLKAFEKEVKVL